VCKDNNQIVTADHIEIAKKFNDYVINVEPRLAEKLPENKIKFTSYSGTSCKRTPSGRRCKLTGSRKTSSIIGGKVCQLCLLNFLGIF